MNVLLGEAFSSMIYGYGILAKLRRNRDGNFGMMTAILLPVLVAGAGIAMDTTNLMLSRSQLQQAADAAALATSSALVAGTITETTAPDWGKNFVYGQIANFLDATSAAAVKNATNVTITTSQVSTSKNFSVTVSSSAPVTLTPFTKLFTGRSVTNVAVAAQSAGTKTPPVRPGLSMELVLDDSGSMTENTTTVKSTGCIIGILGLCIGQQTTYVTKAEALKQAVASLYDALDKSDPNTKYVRTGAIAYAAATVVYPNGIKAQKPMAWGTTGARGLTLAPGGGTDATAAVNTAAANIKANSYATDAESVEHKKKRGDPTADRSMVLMTDGEMTGNSTSWSSVFDASTRKACSDAKDAGIRIFTVAFMAPEKGKSLLQFCASAPEDYYQAETMDTLIASFKAIAETAGKASIRLTN
jgi:Flp pilus assembly protein TadG